MADTRGKDINACIWPYYDCGLLLKIVDYYLDKKTYERRGLLEQKLRLLSKTMMSESARNVFKELRGEEPVSPGTEGDKTVEIEEQGKRCAEKKAELEKSLEKMLGFLRSQPMVEMLKEEKLFNMSYIKSNFDIDEAQLELLFDYAKLLYDTGAYAGTYPSHD